MINKIILTFLISFFSISAIAQQSSCGKNYSSLVLEEESGNILLNTRSDKIIYPASLVKVMTLYL
ncbi:MAG: D-alanyl-D-alanine carboxypeptidase, partial [Pelagibacterales bacterium]|nr:D-alanyl-D-alanine carboxypeptidase [Pelagibacterales bacterium]